MLRYLVDLLARSCNGVTDNGYMLPRVLVLRAKLPAKVSRPVGMNSADQLTIDSGNSPSPEMVRMALQWTEIVLHFRHLLFARGLFMKRLP